MAERAVAAEQRRRVFLRANGCCEYCRSQARFALQSFSVDHIVPRNAGGLDDLNNLALACQGCNSHKYTRTYARDPVSGATARLYHPRRDRWSEHFAWNEDFTLILGLSASGRATVEVLQLNRSSVVNLRRLLYQAGEHPPLEASLS